MTKDELKKKLEDYHYDSKYIKVKIKEIDKMKKQCDSISDEKELSSLRELMALENQRLHLLISKKKQVEDVINSIEQPYKTIMYLKYIGLYTFDQIAAEMNYSTKRIYQLHKLGFSILLDVVNESQKD